MFEMASAFVKDHPLYGSSAFSARHFSAAEVVLAEEPLLLSAHPGADRLVQQLCSRARSTAQEFSGAVWYKVCTDFVAFCQANASTQQQVLEQMHSQPLISSPVVAVASVQARVLSQLAPALLAPTGIQGVEHLCSEEVIQQVLLAFHLNAHDIAGR